MKTQIAVLFAVVFVISAGYTASAQTADEPGIVINEVDTNPRGSDSASASEWIEIHNPTTEHVTVGQWEIVTGIRGDTFTIVPRTVIGPGQFLLYSYQPAWFADRSEYIELRDTAGVVIDRTPSLTDIYDDGRSWQRTYDGVDSDDDSDWIFDTATPGSSNGVADIVIPDDQVTVTLDSEKSEYVFGESVVLSGAVSERIVVVKPYFSSEEIVITITGPDYSKTITKYPDLNLEFSTSINLQRILGISEGVYNVTARYADAVSTVGFSVGRPTSQATQVQTGTLNVTTDAESYIPGQTVVLEALATMGDITKGLTFTVTDPNDVIVVENTVFSQYDARSRGSSEPTLRFTTDVFINIIPPVYGTYQVSVQHLGQTSEHTFEVTADVREKSIFSINTDKDAYEPGDTVVISGRSNKHWISTVSLEVLRTDNLAPGIGGSASTHNFRVLETIRLDGDGRFGYEIPLHQNFASFGSYLVSVSSELGKFSTEFVIVRDAANFVVSDEPLFIMTDKTSYTAGDTINIRGTVKDLASGGVIDFTTVAITVDYAGDAPAKLWQDLALSLVPDAAGNFMTDIQTKRVTYGSGPYTITARYGNLANSITVTVADPLVIRDTEITTTLDKDVYGFGETVTVTGTLGAQTTKTAGLTLYKPNGDTDKFGAFIEEGVFVWTWDTPISKSQYGASDREVAKSNTGVYRLNIQIDNHLDDVFFKISDDPANDVLDLQPLTVNLNKQTFQPGDQLIVRGSVVSRIFGNSGSAIPETINIKVFPGPVPINVIYEGNVLPDPQDNYHSSFNLPIGVFDDGKYTVRVVYRQNTVNAPFIVSDSITVGGDDDLAISFALDKQTYRPGETVNLEGRSNKIAHITDLTVNLIKHPDSGITCPITECGTSIRRDSVTPDAQTRFTYSYTIPEQDSIGSYDIIIDAKFDVKSVTFEVAEKSASTPSRIIDKVNRIAETQVSVTPEQRSSEGFDLTPRVFSGSLLTPVRGQESEVNLRVVSFDGVCIIGQADECMISNSTRQPGSIYSSVSFGGEQYKVRYSGPDVLIEKFSILSESLTAGIPLEPFDITIIKDEQPSRFYYKIIHIYTG